VIDARVVPDVLRAINDSMTRYEATFGEIRRPGPDDQDQGVKISFAISTSATERDVPVVGSVYRPVKLTGRTYRVRLARRKRR
jgi:hypothetical protein